MSFSLQMPFRILALLIIGAPMSAQAKTDYETEGACYETYLSADRFSQDYSNGLYSSMSMLPSKQARNGEYALRLYRSGNYLDAKRRKEISLGVNKTALEAYGAHLEFISSQYDPFSDANSTNNPVTDYVFKIQSLQPEIQKCDRDFKIPPSIVKISPKGIVGDHECIIRYATMFSTYNQPAPKKYFDERAAFAIQVDKFLTGYETGKKKLISEATVKGRERAKKNFNSGGTPNSGNIISALENVQICDVKYGLSVTQIPQGLISAASGKTGPK